jgi:hypothetical protein
MSNIQSYNALIDRFKAFASGHFILKRFSHGQIEVSDLEKFGEYPFMHVVPSNVTYAKGMKTFSFQIVLADMPRDKEDKTEYQREVLSDLQRIAEDLVAEITNHRVLFGDLITVNNVSLEPFLEEFQHTLTGWTISLDLLVPYYWDACSIPAEWNDMFESSTGGTGSILTFIDSITRDENGNVSLVNDEAEPSPNYYYGTDDEGVRGWYLLETGGGLTCETIGDCQTIIDIEAAIDALEEEILLKADITSISAVGFSNDYNDLDNKPTIPDAQVNSDWNATSGVAEILNKPTIPTSTSDLTNDGEDGVNPFITAQDLPDTSGFVPYTGATQNVNLGTHTLSAKDLVINHSSGSGVAASITKGGAGEALTVNKTSGSGNAMSVTGGVTQLSELHLTTDLADAYIASAATWNAKVPETRTLTINGTTQDLSANRTFTIATGLTVGTTPITSGTVGRVLFEGTGNVLQQSANLFWDNTNSRLGIGTASPSQALSVQNGAIIGNASFGAGLVTTFDGTWINLVRQGITTIIASGSGGNAGIGTLGNAPFTFLSNGLERLRIFAGGNVAIGTTTDAGFRLDVNGNSRVKGAGATDSTSAFLVQNSAGNTGLTVGNGLTVIVHQDLQLVNTVVYWNGGTQIRNISNGVLRITNSSNSDFTRLQFGGGTTAFPSLQRSGAALCVADGAGTFSASLLVGTTTDIASSKLTIASTTQGFLPPRMTNAQRLAIASPAIGLIVYCTDLVEGLYVNKSTGWTFVI